MLHLHILCEFEEEESVKNLEKVTRHLAWDDD